MFFQKSFCLPVCMCLILFLLFPVRTPHHLCLAHPATGKCRVGLPWEVGKVEVGHLLASSVHTISIYGFMETVKGIRMVLDSVTCGHGRMQEGLSLFHKHLPIYGQSQSFTALLQSIHLGAHFSSSFALSWASVFPPLQCDEQIQHTGPWGAGMLCAPLHSRNFPENDNNGI